MALCTLFLLWFIQAIQSLDINRLTVPTGFTVTRYIPEGAISKPRSLAVTVLQNGTTITYVGTGDSIGIIHALIDYDSDGTNDEIKGIWQANDASLQNVAPKNLALDNKDNLYISHQHKTYRCQNVHNSVLALPSDAFLNCSLWFVGVAYGGHGDHYMTYDEINDQLCMDFGVNGNVNRRIYPEAHILCFNDMENPDYRYNNVTVKAKGTRHCVGMQFHPITNELWFTDHNRDRMGNDYPDGKLNHVSYDGEDFGFPYCHSGGFGDPYLRDVGVACHIVDDKYGHVVDEDCSNFTVSVQPLGPHVAPDGVLFYHNKWNTDGYMFPNKYYQAIFTAQHGSWNRDTKIGARVMVVYLGCDDYSTVVKYKEFLGGMIVDDEYIARPADLSILRDGSLLVSDDEANNIFRIVYDESLQDDTSRNEFEEMCNVTRIPPSEYCIADFYYFTDWVLYGALIGCGAFVVIVCLLCLVVCWQKKKKRSNGGASFTSVSVEQETETMKGYEENDAGIELNATR